jgi:hypothetical protein
MFALKMYREHRARKAGDPFKRFLKEPGKGKIQTVVVSQGPSHPGKLAHDALFNHLDYI